MSDRGRPVWRVTHFGEGGVTGTIEGISYTAYPSAPEDEWRIESGTESMTAIPTPKLDQLRRDRDELLAALETALDDFRELAGKIAALTPEFHGSPLEESIRDRERSMEALIRRIKGTP